MLPLKIKVEEARKVFLFARRSLKTGELLFTAQLPGLDALIKEPSTGLFNTTGVVLWALERCAVNEGTESLDRFRLSVADAPTLAEICRRWVIVWTK